MKQRVATIPGLILILALLSRPIALPQALGQSTGGEQDPQRPDVVKMNTTLVTVPVVVTNRYGQFVTGLSRNDFRLQENGEPQQITSVSSTETPFNLALLIDTSRSTRNKLGAIRKAALNFIKQLQLNDQVLIVTFDEKVQFLGDFTNDRRELERAVRSVKSSYLTCLYDAVHRTITEKLAPRKGRKAIVLLTDGVDTYSRQATYESTLELVSNTGVSSYAIQYETRNDGGPPMSPLALPPRQGNYLFSRSGRGDQVDARTRGPMQLSFDGRLEIHSAQMSAFEQQVQGQPKRDRYLIASDYLRSLAAQSGALCLRAESIEGSSFAFALIANELRNLYTLAYYPTNDKRDGSFRTIMVRVRDGGFSVRARQGYRTPKDEKAEEND